MLIYEKFSKISDTRKKLIKTIIDFINDVYPNIKSKISYNNSSNYIHLLDGNRTLFQMSKIKHKYIRKSNTSEMVFYVNIIPENSIYEFLEYVFEKYDVEKYNLNLSILFKDVPKIINDLTIENYKQFLLEKEIKKYNI